jgi:hypothetical protein
LRPFVLNLHERLLLGISHNLLIVCQTKEQVNPVDAAPSPHFPEAATRASQLRFSEHQPQKLRVRKVSA